MPTRHLADPTTRALFPVPFWDGERNRVIARATGAQPRAPGHLPAPSAAVQRSERYPTDVVARRPQIPLDNKSRAHW